MNRDDSIMDLEMRLTYQEDDIKALNGVVKQQQDQIDALRRDIERLRGLIAEMAQAEPMSGGQERPPHY